MPLGTISASPRIRVGTAEQIIPSVSPTARASAASRASSASQLPSTRELRALLQQESASELALLRRGEDAALMRINQLKAANAHHERNVALLTARLTAQSELLHEVHARVTAMTHAVPKPTAQSGARHASGQTNSRIASQPPPWEDVYAALMQLYHRLERGTGPSPGNGTARAQRDAVSLSATTPRTPPGRAAAAALSSPRTG